MNIKKQYNNAIYISISIGLFSIADKHTESLLVRVCIVLLAGFAFYSWVKYFKRYIDHKIDSSTKQID